MAKDPTLVLRVPLRVIIWLHIEALREDSVIRAHDLTFRHSCVFTVKSTREAYSAITTTANASILRVGLLRPIWMAYLLRDHAKSDICHFHVARVSRPILIIQVSFVED